MSVELVNSVREMLKEESWTRAGISNFTKNDLIELEKILEQARNQNCENDIKEICDQQLSNSKDGSIVALYLSGMIALRSGSIDTSALITLTDIFENNHKEVLIEYMCNSILEEDSQNKFALRKLAEYYKNTDDNRVWEYYEKIVKLDLEEADLAKVLAKRYESQGSTELSINYYKKALLRYINTKNINPVKEIWSKLVSLIPEEIDFFLMAQRKIAKAISELKSAILMQELYAYYKDTAKWNIAIDILKLILEIDKNDSWARKEIIECFREKYSDHTQLDDYIRSSNLNQSFRDVFEAINDFEKHIAFDAKNFVFHRSWGVGIITKVEGDKITINFGKKNGVHTMTLKMAVSALQPLQKDHIWVLKATKRKEELTAMVKKDVEWTLKTIIKSFDNNCDEKRIKAELVPAILTQGEWTSWHSKAQKILTSAPTFGTNPNDITKYTVKDRESTREERLASDFKADKDFFKRIDILMKYIDESEDPINEHFYEMLGYFTGYLKAFANVSENTVASFLVIQEIKKRISSLDVTVKFTFAELYGEIDKPNEMYLNLKNAYLKQAFISNVRMLPDWDEEYVKLFPTVLDIGMIYELYKSDKSSKITKLVTSCFNEYRLYKNAVVCLFEKARNEEWFINCEISEEKQLITLINIISLCYREINNHVNSVENKKTIKNAQTLLFANKNGGETKNTVLDYMLSKDKDTITRMYTMINDVRDLDSTYKTQIRNGIIGKYPDFKFQEAEIKQEAPKGLLVTAKMLEIKKALIEDIEKVQLPKIAEEISDARAKGDLKENAEYISAKEAQSRKNSQLTKLKEELSRAVVFDPTTVTISIVSFGTTVTLQNHLTDKEEKITILGPWESNADEGIISYLSPLGNNLLDLKVGEQTSFTINQNKYEYTVKAIEIAKM